MDIILQRFAMNKEYKSIVTAINEGVKEQLVTGLSGSTKNILLATLYKNDNKPLVVITHNLLQAQKIYEDLAELVDKDNVYMYPDNEMMLIDIDAESPEILEQRIKVLINIISKKKGIYIIPYVGAIKSLPPRENFNISMISLSLNQEIDLEVLINHLVFTGYDRREMITKKGEFSVRGGIIDIYPLTEEYPIRIELFDVLIDSIRTFNISNQRSIMNLDIINITPARELIITKEQFQQAAAKAEEYLVEHLKTVKDENINELLLSNISWEIEQLKQESHFSGINKYISVLYPKISTFLDFIDNDSIILFDEPKRIYETAKQNENEIYELRELLIKQGEYLPQLYMSNSYNEFITTHNKQTIFLSMFLSQIHNSAPGNIVNFICRDMQNFYGQLNVVKSELDRWIKAKNIVIFLASDLERAKKIQRILNDYDIDVDILLGDVDCLLFKPVIMIGNLLSGFEIQSMNIVIITEGEIFSKKQRKARQIDRKTNADRIKSYTELNIGDYVVHINHGIGVYIGIETLEINNIHKDYLHIKYAKNDKLYVPIDQIDLVQKYIGGEENKPKVYSLGGSDWNRAKSKVKSSVKDIALDLIKLYAKREATIGYSFPQDSDYHSEFAAMFQYEETPDQLKTINEISEDMEKTRPMDRLLCGDVGYGKTEVAVRAAFKAVYGGKQVAVLVPTTILAQQHFKTFTERIMDYPIKIGVISRFNRKKDQAEIIKQIGEGTIDIVIGTHRILSKDVIFKSLGLLIIDEEQKFGVKHKEVIKQLKANIDVLTLTATPIPRTLHMSMIGIRDLSLIETPPENRYPVQTYVLEYSAIMVREALEREIARGGQVYFLHNRVNSIHRIADQVRALVPDARVAVAHGQLPEAELEAVMFDFLDGEYDVLVSTTIIESGVDIPNVNTLIVCDADKMGLSQLYQLRGRVGRSNRIAYSYFTYQRDKVLTEVAEKRLQAIKEFTELGSGFKIAMRDLAIRGAGNLLGAQQHGFIASVGFELYNQMLKEAIEELKELKKEEKDLEPQIEIEIDAYLPDLYINDQMQKIEMYKKFTNIRIIQEAYDLEEELLDRFGELPKSVTNLIAIARLKTYFYKYHVESMTQKGKEVIINISSDQNQLIDGSKLYKIANEFNRRIKLSSGHQLSIIISNRGLSPEETVDLIEEFFKKYQEIIKKGEVIYENV